MAIEITIKSEKKIEAMLAEAREIMQALGLEFDDSPEDLIRSLVFAGLGLLRAHKRRMDEVKAAAEMGRRIQQGPRPTTEEAQFN